MRYNSQNNDNFIIRVDEHDKYEFYLIHSQKGIDDRFVYLIGFSQKYDSEQDMETGIDSVKTNAPTAEVVVIS